MSGLEGKVALVTGAAAKRSMGRAIALQLAKEGAARGGGRQAGCAPEHLAR